MEYREDEYLMLSGIQHFAFCRRQWALIHVEQQWQENEHTVIGELFHKRAHDPYFHEKRNDLIVSRGVPVHSRSMGVSGVCDIIEFYKVEDGISLHGHRGLYRVCLLYTSFSVLEAIQEDSNDNRNDKKNEKRKKSINSTIKDRYFNAACATPASIFPVLFKLKNSHIRKIDSPNMVIHYEKLLTELQSKVPAAEHQCAAYPKRLSLEEQGMFVLGYYHQNEKRYEKRSKDSDNKSNENKGQEAE